MINRYMWIADKGDGTYRNPILYTDYSDPDVIRVGSDYFMIASSFSNTPAIPVLHSKDLVNWKVISYVLEKLPFEKYDTPCHGRGVWAPAIRYHDGLFYVCFPMPDEGIFMCTTENPFDKWSEPVCIKEVKGWIDPCPFWDVDGKAYLVNAFSKGTCGLISLIQITEMAPDGKSLVGESKIIFDGSFTQPVIEGPKLHKRNGYYYVFAPAGSVKSGWQTVLRSENIWGPYQERIVMIQGDSATNGPHQGAWIDTEKGQDWFIHFQYAGNSGRIVHLQPLVWENDWPVIGKSAPDSGYGRPLPGGRKPDIDCETGIFAPDDSDMFEKEKLGLQWQWNANYKEEWFELDTERKQLRLNAQYNSDSLYRTPNIIMQKWTAPDMDTITELELDELKVGDMAGIIAFGAQYVSLAVECSDEGKRLVVVKGSSKVQEIIPVSEFRMDMDLLKIRMSTIGKTGEVAFKYSINGGYEVPVDMKLFVKCGNWVGIKNGLYAVNSISQDAAGVLKSNYFIFQ